MTMVVKTVSLSTKFWQSRNSMIKSIRSKKISQATSSSIETDMTLLMKIRETWRLLLKKGLETLLNLIKLSLKSTETSTLRKCLKMLPNSKSSKPRKMKKPETLRRPSLRSLRHTTRLLTRSWTSTDPSWKVKLLRLSNFKKKLKDRVKTMPKS